MKPHTAFRFSGRKRYTDDGKDERGERHSDSFVIFNLKLLDVGKSSSFLFDDIIA